MLASILMASYAFAVWYRLHSMIDMNRRKQLIYFTPPFVSNVI